MEGDEGTAAVELPGGVQLLIEPLHGAMDVQPVTTLDVMLRVDDMDAGLGALADRGLVPDRIETFEGGAWALLVDPDGYHVWLESRPGGR